MPMSKSRLERLRAAHGKVARLVVVDIVYLPIFSRLDVELAAEEARYKHDHVAYARAALAVRKLITQNQ